MRGGSDWASSGGEGSMSTVSKADVVEQVYYVGMSEVSSRPAPVGELDLGLGLGTGPAVRQSTGRGEYCRIFTAKDFPSGLSSSSSSSPPVGGPMAVVAGMKRAVDAVEQDVGSNSPGNAVVGWPPIRAYRMNSLVHQIKVSSDDTTARTNTGKSTAPIDFGQGNKNTAKHTGHPKSSFVKVNMDGIPIGRKVNLTAHACYESLAQALEEMFHGPNGFCFQENGVEVERKKHSRLLDGSSEFVLTYEDKEGDWLLVGDVPWGLKIDTRDGVKWANSFESASFFTFRMFLCTVRRLRIMRTSDANGLAPRFRDISDRQRSKHV